eukprot:COSAG04_NODE_1792_length_5569_cov_8.635649_4_plen_203_part_00
MCARCAASPSPRHPSSAPHRALIARRHRSPSSAPRGLPDQLPRPAPPPRPLLPPSLPHSVGGYPVAADSRCWLQAGLQQRLWVSWAGANPHMRPCTRPTPVLTRDGGGWPWPEGKRLGSRRIAIELARGGGEREDNGVPSLLVGQTCRTKDPRAVFWGVLAGSTSAGKPPSCVPAAAAVSWPFRRDQALSCNRLVHGVVKHS